jgi:Pyridoxamine 5'-phosphate oxidase
MAKFYPQLDDKLCEFIHEQKIFFTASAPTEGRINLSPKGIDTFRCLNQQQVAYLDLTGSGNETAAHLYQNGRITVMFCSFSDQPLILRLYGKGEVVRTETQRWDEVWELSNNSPAGKFPDLLGKRQLIVVHIESVQTSCGFGVPMFERQEERATLIEWAQKKGAAGVREYQTQNNHTSIDGLATNLLSDLGN